MSEKAEIVKSGTWLYDKQIPYEVWIVKQNFDYFYEEGFEDEPERLNENGGLFQGLLAADGRRHLLGSAFTLEETVAKTEATLQHRVEWDDHRIQPLFDGRRYELSRDSN
jgi:hypothetical protein